MGRPAYTVFESKRSLYQGFGLRLKSLLSELLDEAGIQYLSIEWRVKELASLRKKLAEKAYEDPQRDLTDFCGIRIITFDLNQVTRISELVRQEFSIDNERSLDKLEDLQDNEFGYRSIHFVLTLSDERLSLREYRRYRGLIAELQVRTVLQHAWAVIDHKLRYKTTADVPRALRREIYRVSALLEQADENFRNVIQEAEESREAMIGQVERTDLSIEINFDSLDTFLKHSDVVKSLVQEAEEVGYLTDDGESDEAFRARRISRAVQMCTILGIQTLKDLHDFLYSTKPWSKLWLRDLRTKVYAKSYGVPAARDVVVVRSMLLGHTNPTLTVAQIQESGYGERIAVKAVKLREDSSLGKPK